jgi:hypothetical protein
MSSRNSGPTHPFIAQAEKAFEMCGNIFHAANEHSLLLPARVNKPGYTGEDTPAVYIPPLKLNAVLHRRAPEEESSLDASDYTYHIKRAPEHITQSKHNHPFYIIKPARLQEIRIKSSVYKVDITQKPHKAGILMGILTMFAAEAYAWQPPEDSSETTELEPVALAEESYCEVNAGRC